MLLNKSESHRIIFEPQDLLGVVTGPEDAVGEAGAADVKDLVVDNFAWDVDEVVRLAVIDDEKAGNDEVGVAEVKGCVVDIVVGVLVDEAVAFTEVGGIERDDVDSTAAEVTGLEVDNCGNVVCEVVI